MKMSQSYEVIKRFSTHFGLCCMAQFVVLHAAYAHTSEGGFVLLLPTDVYILSGGLSVALTALTLIFLPPGFFTTLFKPLRLIPDLTRAPLVREIKFTPSLVSVGFLFWLLYMGMSGPRDPLSNPLPLTIWTVWWVGLVCVQGVLGDVWRWINPWVGPVAILRKSMGINTYFRLSASVAQVISIVTFMGFVAILLVDPAPSDPARLAKYVGVYWLFTLLAALIFGPRWLKHAEGISMVMHSYGLIGMVGQQRGKAKIGVNGWQILNLRSVPLGTAVLILFILGSGSFDGLNETFWWLARIGINPLEFPGRSAVMVQNFLGLVLVNGALIMAFGISVWLGLKFSRQDMSFLRAFCLFAPTVLPIALGYHFAHYFTSFLVEIQYVKAAATDPWATGADLFGLGSFYVTTGFFNTHESVRLLWLTQASAIVLGHILAILLAHAVAVRNIDSNRQAVMSQIPLSIFMICYTFLGLWLLASPRGF